MRQLVRDSHESEGAKRAHRRRGWQLFRSLVARKVVEIVPRTPDGARLRVNVELQDDFSMDQTLSLYLIETIPLLDPDAETHALDLLTLVESILENPGAILRRQLDKLKAEAVAEMKAAGMDYEERMAELEKIEHPKPLADFVYATFNDFADRHPWVGEENIRPKSIAREMFETWLSFADYVREYGLERMEGLLLRHLSSVYKVLRQTVPDGAKTDEVVEMELYLRDLVRRVDSSLIEEWERMRDAGFRTESAGAPESAGVPEPAVPGRDEPVDVTRDPRAFTAAIRARVFALLRAWSNGDDEAALDALDTAPAGPGGRVGSPRSRDLAGAGLGAQGHPLGSQRSRDVAATGSRGRLPDGAGRAWTAERLAAAREAFAAENGALRLDPEGRNRRHTHTRPSDDGATWRVEQMLVDVEGHNDWVAEFEVDLAASRAAAEPVLRLLRLEALA